MTCAGCDNCALEEAKPGELPYQVHITVEPAEVAAFKAACAELNVKPLLLANVRADSSAMRDMMTSSVHQGTFGSVFDEMKRQSLVLRRCGFKVVREKIETVPWHPVAENKGTGQYFEAHVEVICHPAQWSALKSVARRNGAYLSHNVMKEDDVGRNTYFITLRSSVHSHGEMRIATDMLTRELVKAGFLVKKETMEFAIFDSNAAHDAEWMGTP